MLRGCTFEALIECEIFVGVGNRRGVRDSAVVGLARGGGGVRRVDVTPATRLPGRLVISREGLGCFCVVFLGEGKNDVRSEQHSI